MIQDGQTFEDTTAALEDHHKKDLPYKNMPYPLYLSATLLLLTVLILGAIFIEDIGTIFEFLSAIAVSCLAFLFPGYFCISAAN